MRSLFVALVLILGATPALAEIVVDKAYIRLAAIAGRPAAAYFTVFNTGEADRLVEVKTDGADRAEIHTHVMANGVMRMRQLDYVDIPAGGKVVFKTGGLHVMMFRPVKELAMGQPVTLTLRFKKAGTVKVTAKVVDKWEFEHPHIESPDHKAGHHHEH